MLVKDYKVLRGKAYQIPFHKFVIACSQEKSNYPANLNSAFISGQNFVCSMKNPLRVPFTNIALDCIEVHRGRCLPEFV